MNYTIVHKHTYQTTLPFTQMVKGRAVDHKKSTLYVIKSSRGLMTTELAPFPGLSHNELDDLERQFEQRVKSNSNIPLDYPHLAFAFFELAFKEGWHGPYSPSQIVSNALLTYQRLNLDSLAPGTVLKIKIDQDINAVKKALLKQAAALKSYVLRLDANQRLTPPQAQELYTFLKDLQIPVDYFEEPFTNIEDYSHVTFPYALDENIAQAKLAKPCALVFKPTQYFSQDLWQQDLPLVLSSTFDSLFTHATLKAMAQVKGHHIVQGLGVLGEKFGDLKEEDVFPFIQEKHIELLN